MKFAQYQKRLRRTRINSQLDTPGFFEIRFFETGFFRGLIERFLLGVNSQVVFYFG